MDNLLKSRISKGEKAYYADEYILKILKNYCNIQIMLEKLGLILHTKKE